ncbi:MAG: hypothetical protein WBE26_18650 [Phycisphaerae bacterium]
MMLKPNSANTARAVEPKDCPGVPCPACGARELVQAYVPTSFRLAYRKGARCLVCGERFPVSDKVFANLRQPVLGEPNEIYADRYRYMLASHMRPLHIVICLGGLFVGLTFGGVLAARFDEPMLMAVFFPITCLGWWFGRWLQPPAERIPGKCPKCRYDLRGLTGSRCPECGTSFLAGDNQRREDPCSPPDTTIP